MVDTQGLVNEFEAALEEELQANHLKEQAKQVLEGVKERIEAYASDVGIKQKIIKDAYARFKKYKKNQIDTSSTAQEVLFAIDEYFSTQDTNSSD
jgi:hypothetical protein